MVIAGRASVPPYLGHRMDLDEFLQLPEAEPALELIAGVVRQKVPPKPFHGRLQPRLWQWLNDLAEERGTGMAFTEARFVHAAWAPVPDIILYRRERLELGPDGEPPAEFTTPPDLAIEIASPGQSIAELADKCRWYADHGVPVALLVHPRDEAVWDFRAGRPPRVLRGTDRIDLAAILPGFELTVAELFGLVRPRWPDA